MDIGELISVSVTAPSKDGPCWCCEAPPNPQATNDLSEDPSSTGTIENRLNNDASKLGLAIRDRPTWRISVPDLVKGQEVERNVEVVPGAHHLIPGNASLKKATALLSWMKKGKNVSGDIGYDVNNEQNGVWLPASYGVRANSEFKKSWSRYKFQADYAVAAMKAAGAQFHDAHPKYSMNVLKTLRSIGDKIGLKRPEVCAICNKQLADKARPPYGLVGRLNAVSKRHQRFLTGPPGKWRLAEGYFTSSKAHLMQTRR